MSQFFTSYHDAYDFAVGEARKLNLDHGIEASQEYSTKGFTVRLLPKPAFCQGFEMRCERIMPTSPRIERSKARCVK